MSLTHFVISVFSVFLLTLPAKSDDRKKIITPFPVTDLVFAQFNQNDNTVQITAQVVYPNGCYDDDKTFESLDVTNTGIEIYHFAEIRRELCTEALVPTYVSLTMSKPKAGAYRLIDAVTQKYLGDLYVSDVGVALTPN